MGAILFLKSTCVNMVMQIRVQIRDTRGAFFMNPPWSVEDLKKTTFCVRVLWILVYFTKMIVKENM